MKKLTASQKKKITKRWDDEFSSLATYKVMWLLRRVGPLLQGICLDRDSSNANYLPTFHVHNLANQDDDFISLSLRAPLQGQRKNSPEKITLKQHEQNFSEFVERFRTQIPIKFEGDLYCDDLLRGYRDYIKNGGAETAYPLNQYHDMVCIQIWCGRLNEADTFLAECRQEISRWPAKATQYIQDRVDKFYGLQKWIETPENMRTKVEAVVTSLKLDNLPCADLLT